MSEAPMPTADLTETRRFFAGIGCGEPEHLATLSEEGKLAVRTVEPGALDDGIRFFSPAQGTHNCYWTANPLIPGVRNRKARRDQVLHMRRLHVDVDDTSAMPRIRDYPVLPSAVTETGGGFQPIYLLDEPLKDIELGERLNQRLAEDFGGDSCFSSDHLLRAPGTVNVLNPKKRAAGRKPFRARLVPEFTNFDRRYSIAELQRAIGLSSSASSTSVAAVTPPLAFHTVESLPLEVPVFTLGLIQYGDDLERPIRSDGATYKSRSEGVFRGACDLARAGADEGTIAGVLMNPVNGISASVRETRDPEKYARRQAQQALRAVGDGWPDINRGGRPTPSFKNALVAEMRFGLRFENNIFSNRKRIEGHVLQEYGGDLSDDACSALRHEIVAQFGFDAGRDNVRDAAHALCLQNPVHPVRDYFQGLQWDRIPRLGKWLSTYLGADDTPLHAAFGTLTLVAAVRRIYRPGTKFDTILVLEGPQGSGKSTAVKILAGEEWFSDAEILAADPKTQAEALEGVLIFELGELSGIHRSEVEKVKAFASRTVDKVRPAYARYREDRPRQNVFIGTTNDDAYLKDATGNRRFWPVRTGTSIDLATLERDRDELWAEAVHLEATGMSLTLPEHLWPDATLAQEARNMLDPWEELLANVTGTIEGGFERIGSAQVLTQLGIPAERQQGFMLKRLAPLMHKHGWIGPKSIRVNKRPVKGYERPTEETESNPY